MVTFEWLEIMLEAKDLKEHFFIEPKPAEPSKHQYDFDAATVIGFLQQQGLAEDFKLNWS